MADGMVPNPLEDDDVEDVLDEEDGMRQAEAFERAYGHEHSWEGLQEDEHGRLAPVDTTAERRERRRRLLSAATSARIRKGMIRYVQLVLDLSRAASANDLRPNRLSVMLSATRAFIREFFHQNPLSQLGILLLRNGTAQQLTELSGTPEAQIRRLADTAPEAGGDASLHNALELASATLRAIPPYGHREVLLLFAALSSCDPGSVHDAIRACKEQRIRVSVVALSAEVYVCRKAVELTGGTFGVALSEAHLEELLLAHAPPPPTPPGHTGAQLVRMGFPQRGAADAGAQVFAGVSCALQAGCYTCPRCKAQVQELPCECHVCGLTLISSPHLARSYHHLFPIKPFQEVTLEAAINTYQQRHPEAADGLQDCGPPSSSGQSLLCFGCQASLSGPAPAMILQCPTCSHAFCFDCDSFIHESLHNCPGCEGSPSSTLQDGGAEEAANGAG